MNRPLQFFDEVIPMGANCETAFALKRFYGQLNSSFFNWVLVKDMNLYFDFLNDFRQKENKIFSGSYHVGLKDRMFCCNRYKFSFHSNIDKKKYPFLKGETPLKHNQDLAYKELQSRINYLFEKLYKTLKSDKKILFIYKPFYDSNIEVKNQEFINTLPEYITRLHNFLLENTSNKNFKLLVILEISDVSIIEKHLQPLSNLEIKYINQFAPTYKANNIFTYGWYNILKDYVISKKQVKFVSNIIYLLTDYLRYLRYKIFALFGSKHYRKKYNLHRYRYEKNVVSS